MGGAAGALIGSQIGGGTGKLVAVAAGTLLGAWAGGAVGRKLDEEDRQAMAAGNTPIYSQSNLVLL